MLIAFVLFGSVWSSGKETTTKTPPTSNQQAAIDKSINTEVGSNSEPKEK